MANDDAVKFGDRDLLKPEDLEPRHASIAISIRVPGDVLRAFKALAEESGEKYQALMNEALRRFIESSSRSSSSGPALLSARASSPEVKQIHARLDRLESQLRRKGKRKATRK